VAQIEGPTQYVQRDRAPNSRRQRPPP